MIVWGIGVILEYMKRVYSVFVLGLIDVLFVMVVFIFGVILFVFVLGWMNFGLWYSEFFRMMSMIFRKVFWVKVLLGLKCVLEVNKYWIRLKVMSGLMLGG